MQTLFSPDGSIDAPLQAFGFLIATALALAITVNVTVRGFAAVGYHGFARQVVNPDMLALIALIALVPLNLFDHAVVPLAGVFRPEIGDGGLVENLTITVMIFPVVLAISGLGQRRGHGAFGPVALTAVAIVLLVAFGEEVSWGQHWFGFTPPEAIARTNLQEEFNLHNYITPGTMETVYYVGGLILLVTGARLGSLIEARNGDTVLLPLRGLLILSGALMCHHIFQELAELAVIVTGFLVWNRLDEGRLEFRPRILRTVAAL
ncbi:hypothetical protein [Maricaulis sp.]|uniref:hypothetical protein n=1 Tax=Maricaulis sp. TaxID=1486257 RepID=UPI002B2752D2|nr:hypothetical protein [Maricaulis sp.]